MFVGLIIAIKDLSKDQASVIIENLTINNIKQNKKHRLQRKRYKIVKIRKKFIR